MERSRIVELWPSYKAKAAQRGAGAGELKPQKKREQERNSKIVCDRMKENEKERMIIRIRE
jgi:hypothetical protein